MTKKTDTSRQRMLAAARKALAARHAVEPVPRFNARAAAIDGVRKRARTANAPTEEQEAKAPYVETDVHDVAEGRRHKIGRAFKRQARFETIEGLSFLELLALKAYRKAFDTSEMSAVKSGLDIGSGGRTDASWAAISRVETLAFADVEVKRIEATVSPNVLFTLRMVALADLDFKAVAIERYGSARGRLRERVKAEFMQGAADLAAGSALGSAPRSADVLVTGQVRQSDAPVSEPARPVDPAFLDEQGFMRPMADIASIIREAQAKQPTD